jgi:ubiquinone/menaquinone biosynthesis C-methylase UbiE
MAQNDSHYIPAFGLHGLTPYYDSFAKLINPLRHRLLQQASIQPGQRVLDVGCGTGLLTLMVKHSIPDAIVTGLDADEQVIQIARDKSRGFDIQWDHAFAFDMPYPDQSFDVVVSSFVMHHLTGADKLRTFREVHRVLRPGGCFHVLDFGPPFKLLTRFQASVMKNFEITADNFAGRIPFILAEAGFSSAKEIGHGIMFFGPVSFYQACKATR